jgi:hypothetical protein
MEVPIRQFMSKGLFQLILDLRNIDIHTKPLETGVTSKLQA